MKDEEFLKSRTRRGQDGVNSYGLDRTKYEVAQNELKKNGYNLH